MIYQENEDIVLCFEESIPNEVALEYCFDETALNDADIQNGYIYEESNYE
ncbi:MAG: hypothetical protein LBD61_02560 [Endomicrobium sp.]|jgi:hypothetical protein|nr:hypothetical protein [Endomicrobium sp.]